MEASNSYVERGRNRRPHLQGDRRGGARVRGMSDLRSAPGDDAVSVSQFAGLNICCIALSAQ